MTGTQAMAGGASKRPRLCVPCGEGEGGRRRARWIIEGVRRDAGDKTARR